MDICKKKQKKLKQNSEEESNAGDFWGYTIVKRKSYFFTSFALGKRTNETCKILFNQFGSYIQNPTEENKLEIYSDGNFEYQIIIPQYINTEKINYGQIIKIKEGGKVVEKRKEIIFGKPKIEDIETTNIENLNTILRARLSRLVRKTQCHAKKKKSIEDSVELFKVYWNFLKPIHKKQTPGMEEGLIHKKLTWGNFLHWQLSYTN